MDKITAENKKHWSEVAEDLDRFIGYLSGESEDLKERLDLEKVKSCSEEIKEAIKNYEEEERLNFPYFNPGQYLKFGGGDGLSYYQYTYYRIIKVGRHKVKVDKLITVFGDYGNSITLDCSGEVDKTEILRLRDSSKMDTDTEKIKKEFESLVEYTKTIPEYDFNK